MREFLGKTKDGKSVFYDSESSHAATHFADAPKLFDAVRKTIPAIEVQGNLVRIEKSLDEVVGNSDLVKTDESDEIVYAKRPYRTQYARFVKGRVATPTSWITLDLRKVKEGEYNIYTAFVGRLTPSFPGGDHLPEQSKDFWSKHALVWGTQEIIPGTETIECPW